MHFDVRCECGEYVVVSEGSAGARIKCECGRTVVVASLNELREKAGLPPTSPSPELTIEYLLDAGMLPGTKSCACCGTDTDESIAVVTECERAWTHRSGGRSWAALLGFVVTSFIFPIGVWLREARSEQVYGRDKVYCLPLPLCMGCRRSVRGKTAIKQYLRQIPEYRRLLEKFPSAHVWVQKEG